VGVFLPDYEVEMPKSYTFSFGMLEKRTLF
jgi:hypothetical protein